MERFTDDRVRGNQHSCYLCRSRADTDPCRVHSGSIEVGSRLPLTRFLSPAQIERRPEQAEEERAPESTGGPPALSAQGPSVRPGDPVDSGARLYLEAPAGV